MWWQQPTFGGQEYLQANQICAGLGLAVPWRLGPASVSPVVSMKLWRLLCLGSLALQSLPFYKLVSADKER